MFDHQIAGGFAGVVGSEAQITGCFWASDVSDHPSGVAIDPSEGITANTKEQMQTGTPFSGWSVRI